MKFCIRSAAGSFFSSSASTSTRRSIVNAASVTRKEQRYAMPPGGLLVYAPSTSTNDFWNGYEPVMMWNRPAGYFDGFAAASNAP